jgi:hypothetical protein
VENSCECGNEPSGCIKCWKMSNGYTAGGILSGAQFHTIFCLF